MEAFFLSQTTKNRVAIITKDDLNLQHNNYAYIIAQNNLFFLLKFWLMFHFSFREIVLFYLIGQATDEIKTPKILLLFYD